MASNNEEKDLLGSLLSGKSPILKYRPRWTECNRKEP